MNTDCRIQEIVRYIFRFLTGENLSEMDLNSIGYTSDSETFDQYKVVVIPSGFFNKEIYGTKESLPELPLKIIDGVPLLYGEPRIETCGQTLIIHADLVASTYFLLSRYEEMIRRNVRDEHGRFPGKESLLNRAGCINRPLADRYGQLFRKWLSTNGLPCVNELDPKLSKIYLTHDVDAPFYCRSFRSVLRLIKKGSSLKDALRLKNNPLEKDPFYTFPWMFETNQSVREKYPDTETILFFKTGGKAVEDKPHYNLNSPDMRALFRLTDSYGAINGFHSSYLSDTSPDLFRKEASVFEKIANDPAKRYHRAHYLTSREPENMNVVEEAGFTDDFTIGYADVAGFRLGTAHSIPFIDPVALRISETLKLHPLTIMDGTLSESRYMHLDEEEAYRKSMEIINEVKQVNGELILLWHNTVFSESAGYHRSLYKKILCSL